MQFKTEKFFQNSSQNLNVAITRWSMVLDGKKWIFKFGLASKSKPLSCLQLSISRKILKDMYSFVKWIFTSGIKNCWNHSLKVVKIFIMKYDCAKYSFYKLFRNYTRVGAFWRFFVPLPGLEATLPIKMRSKRFAEGWRVKCVHNEEINMINNWIPNTILPGNLTF